MYESKHLAAVGMEKAVMVDKSNLWVARVARVVWGLSMVWLSITTALLLYCLYWWLSDVDNPVRYEIVILSAIITIYSIPAGLGVLITGLVPKTGLSMRLRWVGFVLLIICIGIDVFLAMM